jgi:hypothetical protein
VIRTLVILVALCGVAHAYPQFQLSGGSPRCSNCHIAPAGGGLLTQWGQEESGDTLARGGDGHFLHGAVDLPDWLQLGGDFRVAALANDTGDSNATELAAFPMQADVAAHVGTGAWSVTAIVGARGAVRSGEPTSPANAASEVTGPSLGSYVVSREHFVMWKPSDDGVYVRVGRFAAPYGLRLADHTAYIRRYLGYNLMEETYGVGGGYLGDVFELHATAFVYDPLQGATRKEAGGAVLFEMQPGNVAVIGASARVGIASGDTRIQGGVHAKLWLERTNVLLQGEIDGVREMLDGGERNQLAAYVGPVLIPARGFYTGLAYEAFSEDLAVRGVLRQAADAWVSVLPRAHWEVMVSARAQRIGPAEHAVVGMLQIHYWL